MSLIGIVTVCYNSEATILETIDSVNKLLLSDVGFYFRHYIIDGSSTDNTLLIINKNKHDSCLVISESDNGIYDAMNKGLDLVNEPYVWFLNSDDYLDDSFSLNVVEFINILLNRSPDYIIGKINLFDSSGKITRSYLLPDLTNGKYPFGWHPPHPGFISKVDNLKLAGGFDTTKKFASDIKLMLKVIRLGRGYLFDHSLVMMRLGGASNASFSNILSANKECYFVLREFGHTKIYSLSFVLLKLLNKIGQILRARYTF